MLSKSWFKDKTQNYPIVTQFYKAAWSTTLFTPALKNFLHRYICDILQLCPLPPQPGATTDQPLAKAMFQKNGSCSLAAGERRMLCDKTIFDLLLWCQATSFEGSRPRGGHTPAATHANVTASNGPDGASAIRCNNVQISTV